MVNKPHFFTSRLTASIIYFLLWRRFWLPMLLAEWGLYYWLTQQQLITHVTLYLSPLISLLVALEVQRIWWRYPLYWQRLTLLIAAVGFNSLLQAFLLSFFLTTSTSAIFFDLNNRWYFISSLCFSTL